MVKIGREKTRPNTLVHCRFRQRANVGGQGLLNTLSDGKGITGIRFFNEMEDTNESTNLRKLGVRSLWGGYLFLKQIWQQWSVMRGRARLVVRGWSCVFVRGRSCVVMRGRSCRSARFAASTAVA